MLRAAGIDVNPKGYTTALFYRPVGNGILADGKYASGLHAIQLVALLQPRNGSRAERALANYDRPTRKRAYASIARLLARDNPFVYLWWPRQIEAVNDDLQGFRPNGIVEDWNAYQWWL